ncbi:hypothetical protein [Bacillus sp. FJAT-18017]|uniref:hypothetical protein n=1 Tax=Bacillus sp. FJAT-18017 TaxID=1705566 RepID=UPI000B06B374|nr:hypothetical protein [Bacillus sp. FJAT-18017]
MTEEEMKILILIKSKAAQKVVNGDNFGAAFLFQVFKSSKINHIKKYYPIVTML